MKPENSFFTPEGYSRLRKNPFVDEEMLRFIREKQRRNPSIMRSTSSLSKSNNDTFVGGKEAHTEVKNTSDRKPLDERKIRLITEVIRSLLRE